MASMRDRVLELLSGPGRPALTPRAILGSAGNDRTRRKALGRLLAELEDTGLVERIGRRYRLVRGASTVEGIFTPHASRPKAPMHGGGVVVDDGGNTTSVQNAAGAQAGDRVLVSRRPGASEVIRVLRDRRDHWLGIVQLDQRGAVVTPYRDDGLWEVRVGPDDLGDARDGEVVRVEPRQAAERRARNARSTRPQRPPRPRGRVVECLGFPGEPEADFQAVVWRRRLTVDFPPPVQHEADALPSELDSAELARRRDLRSLPFVTIDPVSARDFDDAIHAEAVGDSSVRLWVAIADVSHFVPEGSALDREALYRGNSVYFPDRAIPMLPERLSGDLCSLRPDVPRLAMVAELLVGSNGAVEKASFCEGLIRSCARLTYGQAAEWMEQRIPADGPRLPDSARQSLLTLAEVARRLSGRRFSQGSIELEIPAPVFVVDPAGRTLNIVREQRNAAHRAVEEAMLAANQAVAQRLETKEIPAIYRIHEPPPTEKLDGLRELLLRYGLLEARAGETLGSQQLQRALRRVADRPEAALVNLAVLRSMAQARYAVDNHGHFALGFDSYLHFTSPIRRYADLAVHRALKRCIASGERLADRKPRTREELAQVAYRISERERTAADAEREIALLRACAFMRHRIGEEFSGVVTGVAAHGLYVTLDDFFVEGLVHVSRLPERVEFDHALQALVGPRSGHRYRLGDALRVCLEEVDQVRGYINFALTNEAGSSDRRRSPGRPATPRARPKGAPSRGKGRRPHSGRRRGRR